jgi:elongator complex protein 6
MPSQPSLPHTLIPYISPLPRASLTMITSVLGATSNWLVLRVLYAALSDNGAGGVSSSRRPHQTDELDTPAETGKTTTGRRKVVLVSFLRDLTFWKAEAKRLVRLFFIAYAVAPSTFQITILYINDVSR